MSGTEHVQVFFSLLIHGYVLSLMIYGGNSKTLVLSFAIDQKG